MEEVPEMSLQTYIWLKTQELNLLFQIITDHGAQTIHKVGQLLKEIELFKIMISIQLTGPSNRKQVYFSLDMTWSRNVLVPSMR
jgi:hypothetical protein